MIELGELRDPVVVAAFEGWNDAAEAATGAIDHLVEAWNAELVGAVDPEDYYDFQVNRPTVGFDGNDTGGIRRRITWPTTRVYVASPDGLDHDVVLVRGIEPNIRWRAFCAELLAGIDDAGARVVVV